MVYRTYGAIYDSASINRIFIFSTTDQYGNRVDGKIISINYDQYYENISINFGGSIKPSIYAVNVLYGSTSEPISFADCQSYFQTFVDQVLLSGGSVAPISVMQSQFNSNFSLLTSSLSQPLIPYFEFINFFGSTGSTLGSGVGLSVNLIGGRTYMKPMYNSPIDNPGSGYNLGDIVIVSGLVLGGSSPDNDATLFITDVDPFGAVLDFTVSGNVKYCQFQNHIQFGGTNQYDGVDGGNYYEVYSSSNGYQLINYHN